MTGTSRPGADPTHWRAHGSCAEDPPAHDLDIISEDTTAIHKALATCRSCAVLDQCRLYTDSLPPSMKPQELVQAGIVWTQSTRLLKRLRGTCRHGRNLSAWTCPHCEKDRKRPRGSNDDRDPT